MSRLTKEALLSGSDLREKEVEIEGIGTVLIRSAPASTSVRSMSEAVEVRGDGRDQVAKINMTERAAILLHECLVDPRLDSIQEARQILDSYASAMDIVDAIEELSNIDQEAVEEAEARFPAGEAAGDGNDGEPAEVAGPDLDPEPDLRPSAGPEAGEVG